MKSFNTKLRLLLYILPLLALHFTALQSDAANTSYDGKALYTSKFCNTCHDTALYTAQPIIGIAGRGDDVNLVKNATTTNKSRTGVTTYMQSYQTMWTDADLQAITNYTFPNSSSMPLPTGQNIYSTANKETPVINAAPASAFPIGTGKLNNNILNWQIGLPAFSGPVDILVAIQLGSAIYTVDSNNALTPNIGIWKTVSGSKVNESITENLGLSGGNLSTATLPPGTYILHLVVLPAGNLAAGNTSALYWWSTQFTR